MRQVHFLLIPIAVALCGSSGCPGSSDDDVADDDASGDDDETGDDDTTGDDDATADDDTTGDDDSAGDDDTGPDDSLHEVISFVHSLDCVGCLDLPIFGFSFSETETVLINISLHDPPVFLFADERFDAAVRALPVGSCDLVDPSVFDVPSADCLDAGDLTFTADWDGWSLGPVGYSNPTHNYPSTCCFGDAVEHYEAGRELTVLATGGADIGFFGAAGTSVDALVLLSPVADGAGLPPIDFGQDLEVAWSGGEDDTVRIYLIGEWVTVGEGRFMLGCHAANDGSFTIPGALLSTLDLGQVTQLFVSDRLRYPLGIDELPDRGWTLGSITSTYVFHDPGANPAR